jgi:pilus assembly protein CpaB
VDKKRTRLIASAAFALVGTLLLVGYVRAAERRAVAGERQVSVLVVDEAVPQGADDTVLRKAVRTEQVPAKVRAKGALTDVTQLAGRVAGVALVPGEQVLAERLVAPADIGPGALPAGMVELTLALEAQRAVGGRIRPGSIVSVVGSTDNPPVTTTVVRSSRVMAVEGSSGSAKDAKNDTNLVKAANGELLVTLALAPSDAEKVIFAAEHGHVWLSGDGTAAKEGSAK